MIEIAVSVGLFWGYCGFLSAMAKGEGIHQHPLFHLGSVAVYVLLLCWAAWSIAGRIASPLFAVPFVALVAIIGVFLGLRYWAAMLGEYIERTHAAAIGVGGMKVEETYDTASKAEHESRWADAIAIYEAAAARSPEKAEPLRRAGEAYVKAGRKEEGVRCLGAALSLVEDPEDRATLAFRIAELLARDLGRPADARRVIEEAIKQLEGTKFEGFARDRLKSLSVT